MGGPSKVIQYIGSSIKTILCLLILAKCVYSEVPRCTDILSIERKLNETTMTFEVETNQSETNTLFEVSVIVSTRCQRNLCSIRVPDGNVDALFKAGNPLRLRAKFFTRSKDAIIYAIFFRSSTECKILCTRGYDTGVLKRKKSMQYIFYPKGKRNVQETTCDFESLLIALSQKEEDHDIPTTTPSAIDEMREICGTTSAAINSSDSKSSEMQRGDWPWIAAIYSTKAIKLHFQCSGVLLSQNAIVTTARCLYDHDQKLLPRDLIVFLGKHDLFDSSEDGFTIKTAKELVIHPNYNLFSYQHDIAILKTNDFIEFTDFVAPACIWGSYPPIDANCKCDIVRLVDWDKLSKNNQSFVPTSIMAPIKIPKIIATPTTPSELLYDIDIRLNIDPDTPLCDDRRFGIALLLQSGRWTLRGTGVYCKTNYDEAFEMHSDLSNSLNWITSNIID